MKTTPSAASSGLTATYSEPTLSMALSKPLQASQFSERAAASVWALVHKSGPDDCWPWLGSVTERGYGTFHTVDQHTGKPTRLRANRCVFCLTKGPLTADDYVLHSCDTPLCSNPAHLSKGTPLENMQDKHAKGRQLYLKLPKKLTEEKVKSVLHRIAAKESKRLIAADMGVSEAIIHRIHTKKIWNHVAI